jgi:hypothetical protein
MEIGYESKSQPFANEELLSLICMQAITCQTWPQDQCDISMRTSASPWVHPFGKIHPFCPFMFYFQHNIHLMVGTRHIMCPQVQVSFFLFITSLSLVFNFGVQISCFLYIHFCEWCRFKAMLMEWESILKNSQIFWTKQSSFKKYHLLFYFIHKCSCCNYIFCMTSQLFSWWIW